MVMDNERITEDGRDDVAALSYAIDDAFHSGTCVAVPRQIARAAEIVRRAVHVTTEAAVKDYCLVDLDGSPLGTVPAATARPHLGTSAPAVYLRRVY